jgi:spore germination protein KC
VDVQLEGIVEEANPKLKGEMLKEKEKAAEKDFEKKAAHLLEELQEEKLDPLGFGLLYRAKHSYEDEWERWQEIYPDAKFKVNVTFTIQGSGGLH